MDDHDSARTTAAGAYLHAATLATVCRPRCPDHAVCPDCELVDQLVSLAAIAAREMGGEPHPDPPPGPRAACEAREPGTGRKCVGDPCSFTAKELLESGCAVGVHVCISDIDHTDGEHIKGLWLTLPHPKARFDLAGQPLGGERGVTPCPERKGDGLKCLPWCPQNGQPLKPAGCLMPWKRCARCGKPAEGRYSAVGGNEAWCNACAERQEPPAPPPPEPPGGQGGDASTAGGPAGRVVPGAADELTREQLSRWL